MGETKKKLKLRERVMARIAQQKFRDWKLPCVLIVLLLAALIVIARASEAELISYKLDDSKYDASSDNHIRLSFAGDIMLGRNIAKLSKRIGYDRIFSPVSKLLADSDLAMANLDTCIVDDDLSNHTKLYSKDVHFNAKSDDLETLSVAGFDILSLATDHIADYGVDTVMNAAYAAEKHGMDYVGVGVDNSMAAQYRKYDIDGVRISIFGMVEVFPEEYGAKEGRAGVNSASNANTTTYINNAIEIDDSNIVVVYIHWGDEDMLMPSDEMRTLAQSFIDAGASLVIGSNPRVVLPIEFYKRGVIVYSVGSLVFDDASSRNCDSVLVDYVYDEETKAQCLEFTPLRIKSGIPSETTNSFYVNRIFNTLTKKIAADTFEVNGNKLTVKLEYCGRGIGE